MSILHKTLNTSEISALELLLNGAFAPLQGYLNQADHSSVLRSNRLANGRLWPLPFSLPLSAAEKREAQLSGRIALLDGEQRSVAEVWVEGFHRLPADVLERAQAFDPNATADTWYASGKVQPLKKILHPAFNSIRHNVPTLRPDLQAWGSVIAIQAAPTLDTTDLQRACEWLGATQSGGGLLVQMNVDESSPDFHEQVRSLRSQVKCTAARQVKLSLLPCVEGLGVQRCLLLQALVSRNYGATGFVISTQVPPEASRWLLQHRDEIGLEIIPAQRSRQAQASVPPTPARHPLCLAA
jgi:sulfate adenylyltransferase